MSSWNLAPKVYSQAAKAGRHAHQQWWETPSLLEICVHVKLEPSANRFRANLPGGETTPTSKGVKPHLCLKFVSMSSYALEQKRVRANHRLAGTHAHAGIDAQPCKHPYEIGCLRDNPYDNICLHRCAAHTQHDKGDAPTAATTISCVASPR